MAQTFEELHLNTQKVWGILNTVVGHLIDLLQYEMDSSTTKEMGQINESYQMMFTMLHNYVQTLVNKIIADKEIPKGKTTQFSKAAQFFTPRSTKVNPNLDPQIWIDKATPLIQFLLSSNTWETKQEASLIPMGSFKVHNTIRVSNETLQGIKEQILHAEILIKASAFPGFHKVLYGDVFLVNQLRGATTMAWYNRGTDMVYLRPRIKWTVERLESFIHELGHRYWTHFADPAKKEAWDQYHRMIELPTKVPAPVVNTPVPWLDNKVIHKITGKDKSLQLWTGPNTYFDAAGFAAMYRQWAKLESFPSLYASESTEEHFCECLAFLTVGTLKPNLAKSFRDIWFG